MLIAATGAAFLEHWGEGVVGHEGRTLIVVFNEIRLLLWSDGISKQSKALSIQAMGGRESTTSLENQPMLIQHLSSTAPLSSGRAVNTFKHTKPSG